jgi:M6 family metalloprotease-like protein
LALAIRSSAAPHTYPNPYPNQPKDHVHYPSAYAVRTFGALGRAIARGATGSKNVAVLIVQFQPPPPSEASLLSDGYLIQSLSGIQANFTQMAVYYHEVSYGAITLNFTFFGSAGSATTATGITPITLGHTEEYYGCGDEGPGSAGGTGCASVVTPGPGANGDYLIRDALEAASPMPTNPPYDALILIHAGNGNETSTSNGDIWSIFYSSDPVIASAGAGFDEGDVDPESEDAASRVTSPLGVMCHEFGHTLGLPDLYNTQTGISVVGYWELMDFGPYAGAGANPSHMGAWDKQFLSWTAPQTVTTNQTIGLGYVETTINSLFKFPVANGLPQEYFLVEYRAKNSGAAFDQQIPGTGLLIWHVDDAITAAQGVNNSNTVNIDGVANGHYGVSIVTADGATISSSNEGDAGNAYTNGGQFTSPQSNNFAGQQTKIGLFNIRGVGTSVAAADAANIAAGATQAILKVVNYPNPAGKGYPHPNGEGHTTIQFQLTRPAESYQINVYTLSGDLVRKITQDQITLNTNRSADQKWVYEYVWDLTNGDGAMVAPGVYFYLIRADGQSQTGKAVIIR